MKLIEPFLGNKYKTLNERMEMKLVIHNNEHFITSHYKKNSKIDKSSIELLRTRMDSTYKKYLSKKTCERYNNFIDKFMAGIIFLGQQKDFHQSIINSYKSKTDPYGLKGYLKIYYPPIELKMEYEKIKNDVDAEYEENYSREHHAFKVVVTNVKYHITYCTAELVIAHRHKIEHHHAEAITIAPNPQLPDNNDKVNDEKTQAPKKNDHEKKEVRKKSPQISKHNEQIDNAKLKKIQDQMGRKIHILSQVFEKNTPHYKIHFNDLCNLVKSIGGRIEEGSGSRVRIAFDGVYAYAPKGSIFCIHKPHKSGHNNGTVASYVVKTFRSFFERAGITPQNIVSALQKQKSEEKNVSDTMSLH